MASNVIVRSVPGTRFTQEVQAGNHELIGDEPVSVGGDDRGPGPYDYLLTALGTCKAMTMSMYAKRKGIELESVEVRLDHGRIHSKDCEDCETPNALLDEIQVQILLKGNLDEAERERLMEIATRCPVHRTLVSEVKIRTTRTAV